MLLFCSEEAGRVSVYMGATHSPFHLSLSFIIQSQQKVCSEKLHLVLIRRAPIIIFPVITAPLSLLLTHLHIHTQKFFISFEHCSTCQCFQKKKKTQAVVY